MKIILEKYEVGVKIIPRKELLEKLWGAHNSLESSFIRAGATNHQEISIEELEEKYFVGNIEMQSSFFKRKHMF